MAKGNKVEATEEVQVQLATRIPKALHRTLKTHCVQSDVSVMDFIVGAIESALPKAKGRKTA